MKTMWQGRALALWSLGCLSSFAGNRPPVEQSNATTAALDVLFQSSQATLGVKQSVLDVRLDTAVQGELSEDNPYRELVRLIRGGEADQFQESIWSSWTPGHLSAVAEHPHLKSDQVGSLPFAGFYWGANRGVRINFNTNECRLFDEFGAFGVQVWPQDFHGFYGATQLVSMASYAQSIGMLETRSIGEGQVCLRFPCNPSFSPDFAEVQTKDTMPWIEVDVQIGDAGRILRRRIMTLERGVLDECINLAWEPDARGQLVPNRVEYRVDLSGFEPALGKTFLVFTLRHEITAQAIIDGQSVFDLVKDVGFFSGSDQKLASPAGGDRLVQAGIDMLQNVRDWTAPVQTAREELIETLQAVLADTKARVAGDGPGWPGMDQGTVDRLLVAPMQPFDMEKMYCSQLGITMLRRMHEQSITFGEVLAEHPAELMPVADIVRNLQQAGLDYAAVRSDDIEDVLLDEPFLVLMGEDPAAGHLGVALRTEEGMFRIWSAPNQNLEVPKGAMDGFVPLGIYIIPNQWVGSSSFNPYTLVGCALAALALLILLGKRRATRAAGSTVVCLALLSIVSCAEDAHAQSSARLIRAVASEYTCDVGLAETRRILVGVENVADSEVRIVAATPSCACIEYIGPEEITLAVGQRADLPLLIDGTVVGQDRWRLDVIIESHGATQRLAIPIAVTTTGRMYTIPAALRWTGRAGDAIPPFQLISVATLADEAQVVTCEVDLAGLRIELTPTGSGAAHGGHGDFYQVSGTLPQLEPGSYIAQLSFSRSAADGAPRMVLDKRVSLILSE